MRLYCLGAASRFNKVQRKEPVKNLVSFEKTGSHIQLNTL